MARIYTKHGDQGQSSLVGGQRVNKNHPRLVAYGCIDELNSQLGLLIYHILQTPTLSEFNSQLQQIQNDLFTVGSLLACEKDEWFSKLPQLNESAILALESQIDFLDKELPPLKNFILPQGHIASTHAHICRTVCRRAERDIFSVLETIQNEENSKIIQQDDFLKTHQLILKYINRLSDYLFIIARSINFKMNISDIIWTQK